MVLSLELTIVRVTSSVVADFYGDHVEQVKGTGVVLQSDDEDVLTARNPSCLERG